MYPDHPVTIELSNKRYSGVTLYGAIGNCLYQPVYMTGVSTNSNEFKLFIEKIIAQIRPGRQLPYLVHDGHRAHYSLVSRALIEAHF